MATLCKHCRKGFLKDFGDGQKLISGEFAHIWCRTAEEQLECMLGMTLEEANDFCEQLGEQE